MTVHGIGAAGTQCAHVCVASVPDMENIFLCCDHKSCSSLRLCVLIGIVALPHSNISSAACDVLLGDGLMRARLTLPGKMLKEISTMTKKNE